MEDIDMGTKMKKVELEISDFDYIGSMDADEIFRSESKKVPWQVISENQRTYSNGAVRTRGVALAVYAYFDSDTLAPTLSCEIIDSDPDACDASHDRYELGTSTIIAKSHWDSHILAISLEEVSSLIKEVAGSLWTTKWLEELYGKMLSDFHGHLRSYIEEDGDGKLLATIFFDDELLGSVHEGEYSDDM